MLMIKNVKRFFVFYVKGLLNCDENNMMIMCNVWFWILLVY